jgi:hypothetical protein
MSAVELLIAWEYPGPAMLAGIVIAIVLAVALLVPYLLEEIKKGKVSLGPNIPDGTGDAYAGRRGDPAPGHPDAQADPYDPGNSR